MNSKKYIVIIICIIFSFTLTEIIFSEIIGFPKYGVSEVVFGIQKFRDSQRLFKPDSYYLASEGRYLENNSFRSFKRNNAGLPGSDIILNDVAHKNVCVLGSSYVEALQIEPDSIATSILNGKLKIKYNNYQTVNLGAGGHDIYDSYFRMKYFKEKYHPSYVIYVLDGLWFNDRADSLTFVTSTDFGRMDERLLLKTHNFLRNNFSTINLFAEYFKEKYVATYKEPTYLNESVTMDEGKSLYNLSKCIEGYSIENGSKFVLVSLLMDENVNIKIQEMCTNKKVKFFMNKNVMNTNNLIGGGIGHLNQKGNYELGIFLFDVMDSIISKTLK